MVLSPAAARVIAKLAIGVSAVALLLLASAAPGTRLGLWNFRTAFGLMGCATFAAIGALIVGIAGIVMGQARGFASLAVLAALVALSLPIGILWRTRGFPAIHDITTDTAAPPAFVAVLPKRGVDANPVEYGGAKVAEAQRRAYPDIDALALTDPPSRAFERAQEAAKHLGWEIVAALPAEGRIEATDTTFWFGFKDDIVVRIRPEGTGSRVDVRSLSRVGRGDLGKNAARIRAFLNLVRG